MLIKTADDRQPDIRALERLLARRDMPSASTKRIEAELRQLQAGAKGERDAAYIIDFHFGRSRNWAVIHDLRIEVGGHVAQIDHLVINRLAHVWVCESKHFAEGVSVNEHGEWSRWWRGRQEGIPSPVEQNRRHVLLLERAFDDGLVQAPKRLGLVRWKPELRTLVLVSDNARIGRPKQKVDGLDDVIKAGQLKTRLFKEFDEAPARSALGMIGKEGLEAFARELAGLHRPAPRDWEARFGLAPPQESLRSAPRPSAGTAGAAPRRPWKVKYDGPCANCGRLLTMGTEAVWDNARRRMFCLDCSQPGQ